MALKVKDKKQRVIRKEKKKKKEKRKRHRHVYKRRLKNVAACHKNLNSIPSTNVTESETYLKKKKKNVGWRERAQDNSNFTSNHSRGKK